MVESADRLYERLLVLRCQLGDRAAFAELVERYHARLRYFMRRLLDDAELADDLLQDTWLDVLRGIGRLNDSGALPAWLYRVARNRVYEVLRRRQRPVDAIIDVGALPDECDDDAFGPEDAASIHAALGRLAPIHREVLLLRFVEALSYADIASTTEAPLGTVRSRLHHAKRALRELLQKGESP